MNKTPIMVLQDVSVKLGTLPIYTDISLVTGTHKNQFVIRVTWRNYTTEGVASNKKEAKQNAARNMLSLLSSSKEIPEQLWLSVAKPKTNVTSSNESNSSTLINDLCSITTNLDISDSNIKEEFSNYIGLLNEHCQQSGISIPIYENVTSVGPSHLPVFTVNCTAGSVCQEGSASTKKAAKQKAAKQVLEILQSKMHKTSDALDNLNVQFMELPIDQSKYDKLNSQKILAMYGRFKRQPVLYKPSIKVEDYTEVLSNLCHSIPAINKNRLKNLYNTFLKEDLKLLQATICEAFNTNMEETNFNAVKAQFAIGLKLNTNPTLFQIGLGATREVAKKNALHKLYKLVFLLLK